MAKFTVTFEYPAFMRGDLIPYNSPFNPILVDSDKAEALLQSLIALYQEQSLRNDLSDSDIKLLQTI